MGAHMLRELVLEVEADSENVALAAQPRLDELVRERLPQIVERVLDAFDVPDLSIRLGRVEAPVGLLDFDDLDAAAIAIEAALREAMAEAIAAARVAPDAQSGVEPLAASLANRFGEYLATGRAPDAAGRATEAWVDDLARQDPAALIDILRRSTAPGELERLVLQLRAPALERLLRLAAPEAAGDLLRHMAELAAAPGVRRLLGLDAREAARWLWRWSLRSALHDGGGSEAALVRLVREAAAEQGREAADLLSELAEALRPAAGSASALAEVAAGLTRSQAARKPPRRPDVFDAAPLLAEFERFLKGALPAAGRPVQAIVLTLAEQDAPALEALFRRGGRSRETFGRLADALDATGLRRLLEVLEPEHAATILAYHADLRSTHRSEPLIAEGTARFDRLVWVLTLTYVADEPAGGFNRRSFLRRLIERIAEDEGLPLVDFLRTLKRALRVVQRYRPLATSLPGLVSDIVIELEGPPEPPDAPHAPGDQALEALDMALEGGSDDQLAAALGQAWAADPAAAADRLRSWTGAGARAARVRRLSRLPAADLAAVLAPGRAAALAGLAAALDAALERAAWTPEVEPQVWNAILQALLAEPRERADVAELGRRAAAALSRRTGVATSKLDPTWVASPAAEPQAPAGAADLLARYDRREALLAYLQSGAVPWRLALATPPVSVVDLVADIAGSSVEDLQLLLQPLAPEAARQALERLLRTLSGDRRAALIRRWTGAPDEAPTQPSGRESVAAHAARLLALLGAASGRGPRGAAGRPAARKPGAANRDLAGWTAAALKDAVLMWLRTGRASPHGGRDEPALAQLLAALASRYPQDTRLLLGVLAEEPDLAAVLAERLTGEDLLELAAALDPSQAGLLRLLAEGLARLPPPHATTGALRRPAAIRAFLRLIAGRGDAETWRGWLAAATGAGALSEAQRKAMAELVTDWRRRKQVRASDARLIVAALTGRTTPAAPRGRDLDETAFAWLESGAPAAGAGGWSRDALLWRLDGALLARGAARLAPLRERLSNGPIAERLVQRLPDPTLARLALALEPRGGPDLLAAAGILRQARAAVADEPPERARAAAWATLLRVLATPAATAPARTLVEATEAEFAGRSQALAADVLRRAAAIAQRSDAQRLVPLFRPRSPTRVRAPEPGPTTGRTAFALAGEENKADDGVGLYVENAGLVLANPFLPHLIRGMDLLVAGEDGRPRLRDVDAVSRAAHLMQHLVDGRLDAPEPQLVLNKLLCGVPTNQPIVAGITLTGAEASMSEQLLRAMIGNWPIISNTSIEGLRQSFLQREGRLERTDAGWRLTVQRRTLDVLVDQVPWSFSVVLLPWMREPLHVSW